MKRNTVENAISFTKKNWANEHIDSDYKLDSDWFCLALDIVEDSTMREMECVEEFLLALSADLVFDSFHHLMITRNKCLLSMSTVNE